MYFVLSKSKDNYLSTEYKLKMFDSMVLPLLLYGYKIWGYEKVYICTNNSVQINFRENANRVKYIQKNGMLMGAINNNPNCLLFYTKLC